MSSFHTMTIHDHQISTADIERLRANAEFVQSLFDSPSMKPSTRRNLKSDWVSWLSFIENDIGMGAFAAMSIDQQLVPLKAYLEHLVSKKLKAITIRRRLAGLSTILRLLGVNDGVTGNPRFAFFKKQLLQSIATPSSQAKPFRKDDLASSLGAAESNSIRLKRAVLLVQLGFDTLCRSSELVELRQSDIVIKDDGSALAYVRRSKNDQIAIGSYRALSNTTAKLVKEWIVLANRAGRYEYLLCPVSSHSNAIRRLKAKTKEAPLTYNVVLGDIKLFGQEFSMHSTRVGSLLELVSNKINDYAIQLAGGWKTSTMISYYARELNVEEGAMRELFAKLGR